MGTILGLKAPPGARKLPKIPASAWVLADADTGQVKWKFQTDGERRFAGTHLHGAEPAGETMPDPFDFSCLRP